ncbi:IS1239%2C transposase%2C putative [Streptococcus pneumoniae]|nr:IS1239%2C transposase%2C putative [Streptococcus pneumoniae]
MQDNYTTKGKHLTIDSRRLIERWKKEGKSNREIASLLGKAPQTIHTEIKRGTVRQCLGKGRFKEVYSADYAQQSYENNRKRSVRKSSVTKELKEKILHYHNQKFSPEMMVLKILARHIHRLKKNSLIGKYNTLVVLISSFLSWIKSLESIQNIPTNS